MLNRILISVVAAAIVSGCSADGTLGLEGSPAWKMQKTQAEQRAYWLGVCKDYGFKPNTDAMAQCIQKESSGRKESSRSAFDSASDSTTSRLDHLESGRRTECILSGGVYSVGVCY